MKQKTYDVIVVGGGAAGLMAAIHAASGGAHTAILDHHEVSGKKILATGNAFLHGKENFNENTGACHWSGRVRIDSCDICRPRRMQGAYS